MFNKRAFLALQQNAWFKTFHPMPYVFGNVNTISAAIVTDDAGFHHLTMVVVGGYLDLAFQDDKCLGFGRMMMHRYKCARLQTIEEAMTLIIEAFMEVIVHPQMRGLLGLLCHAINQIIVYDFHFSFVNI